MSHMHDHDTHQHHEPEGIDRRSFLKAAGFTFAGAMAAGCQQASLDKARDRDQTLNAIATSNLELQAADPEYVSRAGANNAHFLLPRVDNDAATYARKAVGEGTPLNALGMYVQYHMAAVELAHRYVTDPIPPEERPAAAMRACSAVPG